MIRSERVEAGVARGWRLCAKGLEALRHNFGGLVRLVGRATQRHSVSLQPRELEHLRLLGGHAQRCAAWQAPFTSAVGRCNAASAMARPMAARGLVARSLANTAGREFASHVLVVAPVSQCRQ